jgi:signal transduction histidine kinase
MPQRPARLDELAEESAATARLRFGGAIEVITEPVLLTVHPAVVVRIFGNLLSNACRAAGDSGRVRVEVGRHAAMARLAVSDSGSGLQPGQAGLRARPSLGLEIIGSLALGCGGTVHLGGSDLGGLCVTVLLPYPAASQNGAAAR